MNIELKQAAQRALLALRNSQPHPSNPFIGLTDKDFIDHEETIRQLRNALQQPAPAVQAEVTDSMIREAFLTNGFTIKDGHSDLKPYVYAAARAILSLRTERVPMTDEVEKCAVVAWAHFMDTCRKKRVSPADWGDWCAADAIRKAHHGITAQAKKGGE